MTAQPVHAAMSAHADAESIPLRKSWNLGFAWGHTYADMLGTGNEPFALERIRENRDQAVRARTLAEALAHSVAADPSQRAFSTAVMLAWTDSHDERDDAEMCRNCELLVLTDVEDHFVCPCGDHGVTCSEACRDSVCRFPRCADQL